MESMQRLPDRSKNQKWRQQLGDLSVILYLFWKDKIKCLECFTRQIKTVLVTKIILIAIIIQGILTGHQIVDDLYFEFRTLYLTTPIPNRVRYGMMTMLWPNDVIKRPQIAQVLFSRCWNCVYVLYCSFTSNDPFHCASKEAFPKEVSKILMAPINNDDIEIKPDGKSFLQNHLPIHDSIPKTHYDAPLVHFIPILSQWNI